MLILRLEKYFSSDFNGEESQPPPFVVAFFQPRMLFHFYSIPPGSSSRPERSYFIHELLHIRRLKIRLDLLHCVRRVSVYRRFFAQFLRREVKIRPFLTAARSSLSPTPPRMVSADCQRVNILLVSLSPSAGIPD